MIDHVVSPPETFGQALGRLQRRQGNFIGCCQFIIPQVEDTMTIDARIYRRTPDSPPILVEVMAGHVAEAGEPHYRPLSYYPGEFTRLVELPKAVHCILWECVHHVEAVEGPTPATEKARQWLRENGTNNG